MAASKTCEHVNGHHCVTISNDTIVYQKYRKVTPEDSKRRSTFSLMTFIRASDITNWQAITTKHLVWVK
jgi:hypothetical protein